MVLYDARVRLCQPAGNRPRAGSCLLRVRKESRKLDRSNKKCVPPLLSGWGLAWLLRAVRVTGDLERDCQRIGRLMTSAPVDGQVTVTGAQYRALLAVSEAIVSHRDLPALFHDLAGRLHQVVRASIPWPGWCGRPSSHRSFRAWPNLGAGRGYWNEYSRLESRVFVSFR